MMGLIGCLALGAIFGGVLTVLLIYILKEKRPPIVQAKILKQYLPLFGAEGIVGTAIPFLVDSAELTPSEAIPAFWIGMSLFLIPSLYYIIRGLLRGMEWSETLQRGKELPDTAKDLAIKLFKDGMAVKAIAHETGLSEREVRESIMSIMDHIEPG